LANKVSFSELIIIHNCLTKLGEREGELFCLSGGYVFGTYFW
jgi:hypothetical protein